MTELRRPSSAIALRALSATLCCAMLLGVAGPLHAEWPERPITLVVMYAPGGGTDTVLRTLAGEIAANTGWRINVVNRPGAAGALATRYVLNRPSDGYTLLGASNYNKYARISGGSDSRPWTDWYYMQAVSGIASWAVRPDSPLQSFDDVVREASNNPGELTISTSGSGGQWHELAALIARYAGIELQYVPYASGQLATLAGLSGEVDIAGGGVHEHIQFIDAGRLLSLHQGSRADIVTDSGKQLPSIGSVLPSIQPELPLGGPYNLGIKRDTPMEIIRKLQAAFVEAVESETFAEVAAERYLLIDLRLGEAADRRAAQLETEAAELFEALEIPGSRSATELGLPAAENFDEWWPPESYRPLPP